MNFKNNATYRFICRADKNRSLNVYGDSGSVPSAQTNVCLYTSGANDTCQQWIYKESGGNKYFVCKKNPNLALDMYTGSTSGQTNVNAHVYAPSNTSYLAFEDTDSGYIKIRLSKYSNKYLTANQGDNGTNTGRTTHDKGNVYWYAGGLTDHSQEWKPVLVDEGSAPDPDPDPQPGGKLTLAQLKKKFPHGKYWNHVGMSGNNQDGYTSSPCPSHDSTATCNCYVINGKEMAWQCHGFAVKCGYDVYGSDPYTWSKLTNSSALDSLKPGDIVRYYSNPPTMHSIFVTAVSGNTVTFGDCNGTSQNCQIRWNATTTKQKLASNFVYMLRAPFTLK